MNREAKNSFHYVAFLRGINVGGNKKVPMSELKSVFEQMDFGDVRTVLATGNVIFSVPELNSAQLEEKISEKLLETFGFHIRVLLRDLNDLKKMIADEPFKEVSITKATRLYVTFLSGRKRGELPIPYTSPDNSFIILKRSEDALFSVLNVESARSTDAMNIIEKRFGKDITTRNWNTILKICEKQKNYEY